MKVKTKINTCKKMKDATINKEYKFIAYLWNVPWVTQTRLSGGPTRSLKNYGQLQYKCRSTLSVTIIVIFLLSPISISS